MACDKRPDFDAVLGEEPPGDSYPTLEPISEVLAIDIGDAEAYVTAFGRNLLDDRGTTAAFTVAGLFSFASAREPRTYGLTLGVRY